MSKRKKQVYKKKKSLKWNLLTIIILLLSLIYNIYFDEINQSFSLPSLEPTFQEVNSNLKISYLDVGQADSILIQNNGENMLIDAGNNEDGELLVHYFQDQGITDFKYVVGTHPHEDHIGGLDDIINNFNITTIYLPDVITTTKTFTDVLDAIENKNMTYTVPKIDQIITLGDAQLKVIYTGTDTSDLNNCSIVLKLTFGATSFLFTGDATDKIEKQMIKKDIQSTVLKVGHHGSKYSSTDSFLDQVNPKYAIISVGQNNSYDHPNSQTIQKLQQRNIEIHRTDQEGSIIITSDGKTIQITSQKTNTNGG